MTTHQIRRAFREYFERQGHLALPSASLVPYDDDPSVLLTIAGMQPLKAYFMGTAVPPAPRLTSCQKCFRTVDIDQVGHTARHLTFFEMLGNFSLRRLLQGATRSRSRWELSTEVLGLGPRAASGSRSSKATTRPRRRRGARALDRAAGSRRAHPGARRGRQLLEGRAHRPVRAVHRRSTTTAVRSFGPEGGPRGRRGTATWSTGTWCSCSTSGPADGTPEPAAGEEHRHRRRPRADRRAAAGQAGRCSRPTRSGR